MKTTTLESRVGGQRDPGYRNSSFALHFNKELGSHGCHPGSVNRAVQQLVNLTLVLTGVNRDARRIAAVRSSR